MKFLFFILLIGSLCSCKKENIKDHLIQGDWTYQYTEVLAFYNSIEKDTLYSSDTFEIELKNRGLLKYFVNEELTQKFGIEQLTEIENIPPYYSADNFFEMQLNDSSSTTIQVGYLDEGEEFLIFYSHFPHSIPNSDHIVRNVFKRN